MTYMVKKVFKDASIVFLSVCVVSCSLKTIGEPTPDISNDIELSDDLYNLEPAITPSFVDSAFCTGDYGDLQPVGIYSPGSARSLCDLPPTEDLRGIQFASLNVTSRSAVGAITTGSGSASSYRDITFRAAVAGLSPYIDYEAEEHVSSADVRSLFHTIVADEKPTLGSLHHCNEGDGERDQDCVDRENREHSRNLATFNAWEKLAVEDRLAYMGISLSDWNNVSYHMLHHDIAYKTHRSERKARRRRYIGIFVAVVLTVATAGTGATLGASFGASIGTFAAGSGASMAAAAVAAKAGVALGGMVVAAGISAFTTLVVTGDFKLALKALGAVFQSKIEDAIIGYLASLAGLSPSIANAAVDSYKSGDKDGALEAIGLDIVGNYGHDMLKSLVDEENGLNGFETYINGLAETIDQEGDALRLEDAMAEYTANFMGGYLTSYLHITSPNGVKFVEEILNEGLTEGTFNTDALKNVFVDQVKTHADGLPTFIKTKLGGTDNAEGLMSDVVAGSLLEEPEEVDKAKLRLEQFIDKLKEKFDVDPAIEYAASEEIGKLYDHIKNNGIAQSSVKSYLSENFMVEHLVTTYTNENVAQNGILTAMDYAERHNLDREMVENAMMEDVIETVKEAEIPDEIKNVFGGDDKIIAEFQTSFAIRLAYHRNRDRGLSSEELIEKAVKDLDTYGDTFAEGYVGTYDSAMISAALAGKVDPFLRDMARLYGNGNHALAVQFFKDSLRAPLEEVHIDLTTFDNEEIMDVIQSGINVLLSKGTPPQMLDAMGNTMAYYSQRDVCRTCN